MITIKTPHHSTDVCNAFTLPAIRMCKETIPKTITDYDWRSYKIVYSAVAACKATGEQQTEICYIGPPAQSTVPDDSMMYASLARSLTALEHTIWMQRVNWAFSVLLNSSGTLRLKI